MKSDWNKSGVEYAVKKNNNKGFEFKFCNLKDYYAMKDVNEVSLYCLCDNLSRHLLGPSILELRYKVVKLVKSKVSMISYLGFSLLRGDAVFWLSYHQFISLIFGFANSGYLEILLFRFLTYAILNGSYSISCLRLTIDVVTIQLTLLGK